MRNEEHEFMKTLSKKQLVEYQHLKKESKEDARKDNENRYSIKTSTAQFFNPTITARCKK